MLFTCTPLTAAVAAAAAPPPPTTTMLSKNFGRKFKYLNRKTYEFLAGNLNAKWCIIS